MANTRNSRFQRGSGAFKCLCCGRLTRDTGAQALGSNTCPDCFELAGIYNAYQDGGESAVLPYRQEILHRTASIVKKGGGLDADAETLLDILKRNPPPPKPFPHASLYAVREDERRLIWSPTLMAEAALVIQILEDKGEWPEGFDAVLVDKDRTEWLYADGWSQIK